MENARDLHAGFDWPVKDRIIAEWENPKIAAHIRSRYPMRGA
jgi:hypothetical protein